MGPSQQSQWFGYGISYQYQVHVEWGLRMTVLMLEVLQRLRGTGHYPADGQGLGPPH